MGAEGRLKLSQHDCRRSGSAYTSGGGQGQNSTGGQVDRFNASKRGISTAVDASTVEEADADMAGKEDTKGIA